MKTFFVEVKHHLAVDVTYEIEAESRASLDKLLEDNRPCDLGSVVIENPPEETHEEIIEINEEVK